MSKTKATGVRIPLKLYKLCTVAEPDKTFTEIVCTALSEKYGFKPQISTMDNKVYTDDDIDKKIDNLFENIYRS